MTPSLFLCPQCGCRSFLQAFRTAGACCLCGYVNKHETETPGNGVFLSRNPDTLAAALESLSWHPSTLVQATADVIVYEHQYPDRPITLATFWDEVEGLVFIRGDAETLLQGEGGNRV